MSPVTKMQMMRSRAMANGAVDEQGPQMSARAELTEALRIGSSGGRARSPSDEDELKPMEEMKPLAKKPKPWFAWLSCCGRNDR